LAFVFALAVIIVNVPLETFTVPKLTFKLLELTFTPPALTFNPPEVIFNCPVMVSPVLETTFNVDRAADALFAPVPPNDVDTLVVI
jgi:hypothetical protein